MQDNTNSGQLGLGNGDMLMAYVLELGSDGAFSQVMRQFFRPR